MRRKILLLAKSAKRRHDGVNYGFCVAGIFRNPNGSYQWIRLVADKSGDSIPDGSFCFNPLDIIEADVYPCPRNNQIENHTFDNPKKIGAIGINQLKRVFSKLPHSFFGSTSNIFDGKPNNSLTILLATNIKIYREDDGAGSSKMNFKIGDNLARGIAMTDYNYMPKKYANEIKTLPLAICVASLPDSSPYYKFIASIFPIDSESARITKI